MKDAFGPKPLRLVEHNPMVLAAAAVPAFLAAWAAFAAAPGRAIVNLSVLAVFVLLWAFRQKPWARYREATISADARGLTMGKHLVPREHVESAVVLPPERSKPPRVKIALRGGRLPLEIAVSDVAEGRELLRGLGHDVTQVATSFTVRSGATATAKRQGIVTFGALALMVAPLVAAASLGVHVTPVAIPFGIVAYVLLMMVPARLVVGIDGLSYRWLFWKRFIPYADVAAVTRYSRRREAGLDLVLESQNETMRIPVEGSGVNVGRTTMIEERITEAMDAWKRGGDVADVARLARGERPVADWIKALRAMGAGADAGPRDAPVPRDRLWRIVEDPRADQAARAAAAVALAGEEEERDRLRAAAGATAAPRLRVAIEAAAGADEAAIAEALAAIDQEAERQRVAS